MRERIAALFAIDLRSLAAFRIGLAALLIADLAKRALTLEAHYTDAGVLPRAAASELLAPAPWFASFHFVSGDLAVQAAIFLIAGAVALSMLVGYRTRAATVLSYALLLSVQFRNPLVNHTGDAYLQCLLLWSMFLPLGAMWSVDARRVGKLDAPQRGEVRSPASAALLLQIVVFYLCAGLFKHDEAIWREGQALGLFLHEEAYARPLVSLLLPYTEVLRLGTWAALFLEGVVPVLFLSPWQTARIRTALVAVFAGFHLSIQMCVYIGIFEFTSILALLVFLPGCLWDSLADRRSGTAGRAARGEAVRLVEARWVQALVVVVGVYVFTSNLGSLGAPVPDWPAPVREAARQLRLNQRWAIFTQLDQLDAGWFSVVLQLRNGERHEWLSGRTLEDEYGILEAPNRFAESYVNHNDRRYWRHIRKQRFATFRPALGAYYCERDIGARGLSSEISEVRVYQVVKRVSANFEVTKPAAQRLIQHGCSSSQDLTLSDG